MGSKDDALDKLSNQISPSMKDAFEEYRSLSREGREKVRASAYEVPDIEQQANLEERVDAMREALQTTIASLKFFQGQHALLGEAMRSIAKVTVDVAHEKTLSSEEGIAAIGHIILGVQKAQGNDLTDTRGTLQ